MLPINYLQCVKRSTLTSKNKKQKRAKRRKRKNPEIMKEKGKKRGEGNRKISGILFLIGASKGRVDELLLHLPPMLFLSLTI
jgi:hypothetical protein